jgi:two-component system OmpR family sensor kinase
MMARPTWRGRTLRGRLTLGLVVVLLVAFAVTGIATALFLRGFLLDRLDAQLTSAGGRFSANLEHGQSGPGGTDGDIDNAGAGQSVGTLGVRIVGQRITNAAVVTDDGRNRTLIFNGRDAAVLRSVRAGGGGGGRTIHLHRLGDYRVRAVAGRDSDVQLTGLPTDEVDDTVDRLVVIEAILFGVVVTISGLVIAAGVSRSLLPLRRVADTALHVSNLPLTEAATQLPGGIAPANPTTEVDQVSVAFDHMLDHVRNALAARDHTEAGLRRFVADASHELRTPVATIKAHSEYAARSGEALPEVAVTAFTRIDLAATRMATLVDDLLLLARLDAGRPLARDTVDVSQLVLETVDDTRTAAPDYHWHLDLPEEPVEVIGDGDRLHQVLANLLSNARAHTPAGTTVTTRLWRTDDEVHLEVCDDGPGIAADLQADLFDRFTRGDPSRATGHGSTGLGLAIAHGIAVAHGGGLEVTSRPGRTCFDLRLPDRRDHLRPAGRPQS